jgi:hypothetical protein
MANDIIFTDDIQFENGDVKVLFSDQQHVQHLLLAHPGSFKNASLLGIGVTDYLQGPLTALTRREFERNAKLQLEADGAKQVRIKVSTDFSNIEIDANY